MTLALVTATFLLAAGDLDVLLPVAHSSAAILLDHFSGRFLSGLGFFRCLKKQEAPLFGLSKRSFQPNNSFLPPDENLLLVDIKTKITAIIVINDMYFIYLYIFVPSYCILTL
jgi:hypothetical protein